MISGITSHNVLLIFPWRAPDLGEGSSRRWRGWGERETDGGRDVLSVSMTLYFKTSGMSSQNLCTLETQGKHTACKTGHMANRRTHLRHTSTYANNYTYMYTKTCKTHSTHTYTNINSTESPFISLIFRHIQLKSMLICTKDVIVTVL